MAPIKFDEHIKEKLENRSIKPSEQAWDKLSERLEVQEKSKNSTPYWWLGIAASIIGILFVVSQFWSNTITEETIPKVVETQETMSQDSSIQIANESALTEDFNEKDNTKKDDKSIVPIELKEAVAVISEEKVKKQENDISNKSIGVIREELSFEEQQIKDVVAQVEAMKNDNKTITEDDIDALLIQAQKEIRLNNLINKNTGLVDANALLQDVEDELDQSFRDKVFEALKSSYNSVKTAVAQRNH